MIKSKKIIAIFVSAAMLMTMLASFTTVTYADEAEPAYTTHAWYTFEDGELPAGVTSNISNSSAVDLTVAGKYGKGVEVTKHADKLASKVYPNLKINLDKAITIDEAIEKNLTVEIEFEYSSPEGLSSETTYIYICDSENDDYNAAGNAYMSLKNNGELKTRTLETSDMTIVPSSNSNIQNYRRIKLVLTPSATAKNGEKGWILSKVYNNGSERDTSKWGQGFFTVDIKCLAFRMNVPANATGQICIDNVSIISYPTGTSPVPDRHKFMDKVLTYTDKVGTPAYNSALALFEKSYITTDDISDVLYALEGNSSLFNITDIGKTNSNIKYTSTDTTGGKPILVVGAYNGSQNRLYAAQCIPLTGFKTDGETENKVTYDLGELPEEAVIIKAFIFSSLDRLVPLAVSYSE